MAPEWIAILVEFVAPLIAWVPLILVLTVAVVGLLRIAVCRDTHEAMRPFVG